MKNKTIFNQHITDCAKSIFGECVISAHYVIDGDKTKSEQKIEQERNIENVTATETHINFNFSEIMIVFAGNHRVGFSSSEWGGLHKFNEDSF